MRVVNESVPVTPGRVDGIEAPGRFRWRHRWWQVVRIQTRWLTGAEWWDAPAARALRGADVPESELDAPLAPDVEHWRVEARIVGQGRIGVFDLTAPSDGGTVWTLDHVHD